MDIKELRRLAQAALAGPDGISPNWIKLLQDFQQKASPAAISELLDRLEAAEKECDALRARIEVMERQEPAVWMQSNHLSSFENRLCGSHSAYVHCSDHQLHPDFKPLYALPGAKGEEK